MISVLRGLRRMIVKSPILENGLCRFVGARRVLLEEAKARR